MRWRRAEVHFCRRCPAETLMGAEVRVVDEAQRTAIPIAALQEPLLDGHLSPVGSDSRHALGPHKDQLVEARFQLESEFLRSEAEACWRGGRNGAGLWAH